MDEEELAKLNSDILALKRIHRFLNKKKKFLKFYK